MGGFIVKKNVSIIALLCVLSLNTSVVYSMQENIGPKNKSYKESCKEYATIYQELDSTGNKAMFGLFGIPVGMLIFLVTDKQHPDHRRSEDINLPPAARPESPTFNFRNPLGIGITALSILYTGYQFYKSITLNNKLRISKKQRDDAWKNEYAKYK